MLLVRRDSSVGRVPRSARSRRGPVWRVCPPCGRERRAAGGGGGEFEGRGRSVSGASSRVRGWCTPGKSRVPRVVQSEAPEGREVEQLHEIDYTVIVECRMPPHETVALNYWCLRIRCPDFDVSLIAIDDPIRWDAVGLVCWALEPPIGAH